MADSEDEEIPPERDVKVVFKLTLYRFLFSARTNSAPATK